MTYGENDGRFLLYGIKSQDGCFDFFVSFLELSQYCLDFRKTMTILCTICRLKNFTHMHAQHYSLDSLCSMYNMQVLQYYVCKCMLYSIHNACSAVCSVVYTILGMQYSLYNIYVDAAFTMYAMQNVICMLCSTH